MSRRLTDWLSKILILVTLPGLLIYVTAGRAEEVAYSLPLLDESLSRWVVTDCQAQCDGQVLTITGGNGLLRSTHPHADFIWDLEWRALADSAWDSGLFIRSQPPAIGTPWPEKYQINLKQGEEGQLLGIADVAPVDASLVKIGDWNHFTLHVVGPTATLHINRQLAWSTNKLEALNGFIGIQVEVPSGGQFQFRNMHIRELGFRSLFDGRDLTGWEGAGMDASTCWQVVDGLLVCTGQQGPWLRSQQQYDDFNLRLEYRLKEGGNSGVYVRVPEDGDHHGAGAGVEIQLLDDAAEQYQALQPYQYTASIYAIVPADPRVSRPAGQWNTIEIDCRGTSYHVIHNGITVIQADATTAPELAERLVKGYLGLQNHSEEVWFRCIRIAAGNSPGG